MIKENKNSTKKKESFFLGRFLGRVLVFLISWSLSRSSSCFLDRFVGRVLVFLFSYLNSHLGMSFCASLTEYLISSGPEQIFLSDYVTGGYIHMHPLNISSFPRQHLLLLPPPSLLIYNNRSHSPFSLPRSQSFTLEPSLKYSYNSLIVGVT